MHMRFSMPLLLVAMLGSPVAVFAATTGSSAPVRVTYTAAFQPQFGGGVPYTGTLVLTYHPDGIISGTYRGNSIRPDPFNNRTTTLTGGVTGKYVHFSTAGLGPSLSFNGQLQHGTLTGTARTHGRRYDFVAKAVHAAPAHGT